MILFAVLAAGFIRVMTPDGITVDINASEIISLREPRGTDSRVVHKEVRCIINMTDAKFVAVVNSCEDVGRMISEAKK